MHEVAATCKLVTRHTIMARCQLSGVTQKEYTYVIPDTLPKDVLSTSQRHMVKVWRGEHDDDSAHHEAMHAIRKQDRQAIPAASLVLTRHCDTPDQSPIWDLWVWRGVKWMKKTATRLLNSEWQALMSGAGSL